ncbi:hypothetical protein ABT065_14340 [Streptomyces sp. NPDC002764]|uniref:hypothetical protein n=1 Tax=Streptomyces sp. NPDC002764 TaxID=3154428 RepID=UPI00331AB01A
MSDALNSQPDQAPSPPSDDALAAEALAAVLLPQKGARTPFLDLYGAVQDWLRAERDHRVRMAVVKRVLRGAGACITDPQGQGDQIVRGVIVNGPIAAAAHRKANPASGQPASTPSLNARIRAALSGQTSHHGAAE